MDTGDGRPWHLVSTIAGFFSQNGAVLALLVLLLLLSAYFSGAETAYSAANKLRLKSLSDKGDKRARAALGLTERFEVTLTTVLCGNNLVNMATASVTTLLALRLGIPETVMTLCITAVVILFGEVLPKTVAKARADRLALSLAPALKFTGTVLFPFAAVFQAFSRAMTRLFSRNGTPQITEEDVHDMIEDIEEGGTLDSDEVALLFSAFEFDEITVGDIYTASYDVVGVDLDRSTSQDVLKLFRDNLYSRMPVYRGSLDRVVGILRLRTFLEAYALDGKTDFSELIDPPMLVAPDLPADQLLATMQQGSTHMAVVTENGRTLGIITIEDLLEELVGEIFDESDVVEDKFRTLPDGGYEVAADLSVVGAFELMEYEDFDREECGHKTLLAWADELNGGKLRRSQSVRYNDLTVTPGRMRHGRIVSFLIRVKEPAEVQA